MSFLTDVLSLFQSNKLKVSKEQYESIRQQWIFEFQGKNDPEAAADLYMQENYEIK